MTSRPVQPAFTLALGWWSLYTSRSPLSMMKLRSTLAPKRLSTEQPTEQPTLYYKALDHKDPDLPLDPVPLACFNSKRWLSCRPRVAARTASGDLYPRMEEKKQQVFFTNSSYGGFLDWKSLVPGIPQPRNTLKDTRGNSPVKALASRLQQKATGVSEKA